MYSETYPNLKTKYDVDNFEVIAKAIENYFSDLFQLTVLNDENNITNTSSSYMQLFDQCMQQLGGLYTVGEVVQKLYETLRTPPVIDLLKEGFVFVPPSGPHPSEQLGFLEKTAVNDFSIAEPLTFIDMVRLVNGLYTLKKEQKAKVQVVQLNQLMVLDDKDKSALKANDALLINLNRELKEAPKWGVIRSLKDGETTEVYCETALTEREKAELQKALNIQFKDKQFIGATANSLPSTGYTAIAWLDKHITKAWNFDTEADFNNLFKELVLTYFGGDSPGMAYTIRQKEKDEFCTDDFKRILEIAAADSKRRQPWLTSDNCFYGGSILTRAAAAAGLGNVNGEAFRPGNVGKVIQIMSVNNWDNNALESYIYKVYRTLPVGFAATLSAHPGLITTDKTSIQLTIKHPLNVGQLRNTHWRKCAESHANPDWFDLIWDASQKNINRVPDNQERFYATTIVLSVIRSKAKKRIISINLPLAYQLNDEEIEFIKNALLDNPYVTQFNFNKDNESLGHVNDALLPVFARNRWLAANNYRPPLIDNYWRQAARFWLIYLTQVSDLLQPKQEHELFKGCVREMGLQGLKAVLALLNDEVEREYIEGLYGKNRPAFYAACLPCEYEHYLDTLLAHLQQEAYFPFGELGIAYQSEYKDKLVSILDALNKLKRFERITLTGCVDNLVECEQFLAQLTTKAITNQWVGFVVIPELDENTDEAFRTLRVKYSLLNNIILKNRHQKAADEVIQQIEKVSHFALPDEIKRAPATLGKKALKKDKGNEALSSLIPSSFGNIDSDKTWPLKRGGVVQLQLQQQQQIEQSRQMQQEQQKAVVNILEQAIAGELVGYDNIDRLLSKYWADFAKENPVKDTAASLRNEHSETLLQGFFHTWINANPTVDAHHVIKKMTLEAAQALVRKHSRLTSGLNPENLPKGFYTQCSKDGYVILCYSPELSYVTTPNALTLDLAVSIPQGEAWKGDFRLLNLSHYTNNVSTNFDESDWNNMILFAHMQPQKADYQEDYDVFCTNNHTLAPLIASDKNKIIRNWPVFLQAWQYAGAAGITQFLDKDESAMSPSPVALKQLLLKQINSDDLVSWASNLDMNFKYLRALGQVYYGYGARGLTTFLSKLRQLEAYLGSDFFTHFNQHLIAQSVNFNCFISENFFLTLDDMMEQFRLQEAHDSLSAWKKVLELHMQSMGWETVDALWRGFSYFNAEINQMGLTLAGTAFDRVKPENMLICMERILNSLNHIPDNNMQKAFLAELHRFDLTNGGVHYALQHEGFKYFDAELKLSDFQFGSPTYAPDLTLLYQWRTEDATLKMKRTLASKAQFSQESYKLLVAKLGNEELTSRHQLMWLFHTQYNSIDMNKTLRQLDTIYPEFQQLIAHHLFDAVYVRANKQLCISLEAMAALAPLASNINLQDLLNSYRDGTVLEAFSILHQLQRWSDNELRQVATLFTISITLPPEYSRFLLRESYKLATLFGITDDTDMMRFYSATMDLRPVVYNELKLLINQVLSIDYASSNLNALNNKTNWGRIIQCITAMKDDMANTAKYRIALMEHFNSLGLEFKYSKSGDFRALTNAAEDRPEGLGFFVDHEDRIWGFMQKHILVPTHDDAKETLKPIVRFLKKLQSNRTYLNEVEPLLSSLEKMPQAHYWSATYFHQLLRAVQPDNDQALFPISLLNVMLQEEAIAPKDINNVDNQFPRELTQTLQAILKYTDFDRNQQGILCQIALREYNWQGKVELLSTIMNTLSLAGYDESRTYVLDILAKSKSFPELKARFANCSWFLQHTPALEIKAQWTQTTALWLKALSMRQKEEDLFSTIKTRFVGDSNTLSLVLHVVAFSTLRPGLRDSESYQHDLNKKAGKLVERLAKMAPADLVLLAETYPNQPSPTTEDIIRLLKQQEKKNISWSECLETFARQPFSEPRTDYGLVASTRDADLQRMISETKVSGQYARQGLSPVITAGLSLIFSYLKQLECGTQFIIGSNVPISQMSPKELADAFHKLSKDKSQDDSTRAQIWAVLFEVLGRCTRKYPHLAQQFALISNDIGLQAKTRVLQLATGEGKSHFVALRAARNAGLGKFVDVCTAKRTLAERDLDDYQSVFDYLNIKTAYIHSKSSRESYMAAQIHYSTLGDLSLFFDEQSYSGQSIDIDPCNRVALFDEFDFIRFEEGGKTQYNYARPIGKTPKQMTWFYQSVNAFYKNKLEGKAFISAETVQDFAAALLNDAGENEERQRLIAPMLSDLVQLVPWIQSAHEAFSLAWGVGFTVREENIEVGDESYPMREIIPLSSDNQKMNGSTFSAGVHQLLAVRLNSEARLNNEAQNFHIYPESHIISSQVAAQRMRELWGSWEGFSGTISAAQAATLNREHGTEVLHVPTNQRDLRFWHKPNFYDSVYARESALVAQVKTCIDKKQSMLFSCKNDQQVTKLQEDLARHFSPDELTQHFIFYTNQEHRTAADVLTDKIGKEDWRGGKKQHAVGLVASGFGRGDNVGVEVVFLFEVNDTNDKLQKGGRTARNGAAGEVFQYYLSPELQQEEKNLWLAVGDQKQVAALQSQLQAVDELVDDRDAQCFERVMLLREYVFGLQNAANQGYHNAIAQYSSWGMKTLGSIADPTLRQTITSQFSVSLRGLDKLWINISSQGELTADAKINQIEDAISSRSTEFIQTCSAEKPHGIYPVTLEQRKQTAIQMVVPQKAGKPTAKEHAIARICSVISRLPFNLADKNLTSIPQSLATLAGKPKQLKRFAAEISSCTSVDDFLGKLELATQHVSNPSAAWVALDKEAAKKVAINTLFNGVSDSIRTRCEGALRCLIPQLQEQILNSLAAPHLKSRTGRINDALPMMEYLSKFTLEQQEEWGADYLSQMQAFPHMLSEDLLSLHLDTGQPMSSAHCVAFGKIIHAVGVKTKGLNREETQALYQLLINATKSEPEQRVRMLTKWEAWSKRVPDNQIKNFLTDFCNAMAHFNEGENWDLFTSLVNKSQDWINKGGEARYASELVEMWQGLSRRSGDLLAMNECLQWAIKLDGKSWFKVINALMNLSPVTAFNAHKQQLYAVLNNKSLKKHQRVEQFNDYCKKLTVFYRAMAGLNSGMQEQLTRDFVALKTEQFNNMLQFIGNLGELAIQQPQALVLMISHLKKPKISTEYLALFAETFAQFDSVLQHTLTRQLKELDAERFKMMIKFIAHLGELAIQQPKTLQMMLSYLNNPELSVQQNELFAQMLLSVSRYQAINTHFTYPQLMTAIEHFKDSNVDTLQLLLKLMDYRKGTICTIDPLIENKFYKQVNLFYRAIAGFAQYKQIRLMQQLNGLNHQRLQLMMNFTGNLGTLATQQPQAVETMLAYCADNNINMDSNSVLSEIILQITRYQAANTHYSYQQLMEEVGCFKNSSADILQLLLQAMDSIDGAIRTVAPLMERQVYHLATALAGCGQPEQVELIKKIKALNAERFKLILQFAGNLGALGTGKPQALAMMSSFLADEQITVEGNSILSEIIVQITKANTTAMQYTMQYTMQYNRLMTAIAQYKNSNVATLQLLLKSINYQVASLDDGRFALFEQVLAQFDKAKQAELAQQLNELKTERFELMIEFTHNLGRRLAYARPRAVEALLSCIKDANISVGHGTVFAEVIHKVTCYEAANPHSNYEQLMTAIACFKDSDEQTLRLLLKVMAFDDVTIHTIDPLISNKFYNKINLFYQAIAGFEQHKQTILMQQLNGLNHQRLQLMIEFTGELGELATQQPQTVEKMLSYLVDDGMTLESGLALSSLMLQISKYHGANPHSNYEQLMTAIDRFKECSEQTLMFLSKTLVALKTNEPLYDNVVSYMDNKVPSTAKNSVLKVVELFYRLAKEEVGDDRTMSLRPEVTQLFEFDNGSKNNQKQRLIWMHLLQQQAFVKANAAAEHHDYIWTHEHNEQLLQSGFDHYVRHTQKVLEEQHGEHNVHAKRDLSVKQQHELLKLADELSIIGKPKLRTPHTPQESHRKAADLSQDLNRLMRTYQDSWFKSKERTKQLQELDSQLTELTANAPKYFEVLQAIGHAKATAMQSDEAQNKDRWFKMNSSGQSRYFNTLNQMQDLVLRKWSLDAKEVHSFKRFTSYNKDEFIKLVRCLHSASSQYFEEHYPAPGSPRLHEVRHKAGFFFGNAKNRTNLDALNTVLANFSEPVQSDTLTTEMVNKLMDELRQRVSTLPGHLVTLANEVLIRGDALALNLGEQSNVRQLKGDIRGD